MRNEGWIDVFSEALYDDPARVLRDEFTISIRELIDGAIRIDVVEANPVPASSRSIFEKHEIRASEVNPTWLASQILKNASFSRTRDAEDEE